MMSRFTGIDGQRHHLAGDGSAGLRAQGERGYVTALLPAAIVLLLAGAALGQDPAWGERVSAGQTLQAAGRLNEADEAYRAALPLAGSLGEKAQTLLALAYLHMDAARYPASEGLFREALEILDRDSEQRYQAAQARSGLSLLYALMGRYAAAESTARRAVAVLERSGGRTETLAEAYLSLAEVYRRIGNVGRAEVYYERSLRITESLKQDQRLAMTLVLLAAVYVLDGRYAQAEELLRRAVTSLQLAAGHDSPEAGIAMARLGSAIAAQQRYAEAAQLQLSGLDILERALGKDHVAVAKTLDDLAETYRSAARFHDAEPLYRRALEIVKTKLGPEHPDLTTCMLHYALLLKATGRKREAKQLLEEAERRMHSEQDPSGFVVDVRICFAAERSDQYRPRSS